MIVPRFPSARSARFIYVFIWELRTLIGQLVAAEPALQPVEILVIFLTRYME